MLATHALLKICHKCPHRTPNCQGPCACLQDGKDIIDHALGRFCPMGRYPADLPDDLPADAWQRDSKGNEGCGC